MRSQLPLIVVIGAVVAGFGSRAPARGVVAPAAAAAPSARAAVVAAVKPDPVSAREAFVESALSSFSAHVKRQSNDAALRTALIAYYNFKAAHPEEIKKPYLYYIDYGLNNRTPRGYVFDMEKLTVVDGPFIVAHGRGSGPKNAVPMRFSNGHGSAATSLGLYVTQETYGFSGKTAGTRYTSIGLRMSGESGRFNSNARSRGVVVHGAPYVSAAGSGRSEGCPAMEQSRARRLLPLIADGAVVFQYSPNDPDWLQNDPWIN